MFVTYAHCKNVWVTSTTFLSFLIAFQLYMCQINFNINVVEKEDLLLGISSYKSEVNLWFTWSVNGFIGYKD